MVGLKDQCFGVEVEMTGITREEAAQALAEYFGTQSRYPRFYDKQTVTVRDGLGRELSVMAYIMDERFREPMLPSTAYYNGILEGYKRNGLPVTALKKAWDHAVREVHQETKRVNAAAFRATRRRNGHER